MKKLALEKSILLASALFCCLATSQIASAADKTVTCQIDDSGRTIYL